MKKKRKEKERALYSYPRACQWQPGEGVWSCGDNTWFLYLLLVAIFSSDAFVVDNGIERVQALHAQDNTTNKRYYEMKSQLGTEINESKYKEEMNAARKKQHDEEEKRKMRSKYKTAKLWWRRRGGEFTSVELLPCKTKKIDYEGTCSKLKFSNSPFSLKRIKCREFIYLWRWVTPLYISFL